MISIRVNNVFEYLEKLYNLNSIMQTFLFFFNIKIININMLQILATNPKRNFVYFIIEFLIQYTETNIKYFLKQFAKLHLILLNATF